MFYKLTSLPGVKANVVAHLVNTNIGAPNSFSARLLAEPQIRRRIQVIILRGHLVFMHGDSLRRLVSMSGTIAQNNGGLIFSYDALA